MQGKLSVALCTVLSAFQSIHSLTCKLSSLSFSSNGVLANMLRFEPNDSVDCSGAFTLGERCGASGRVFADSMLSSMEELPDGLFSKLVLF